MQGYGTPAEHGPQMYGGYPYYQQGAYYPGMEHAYGPNMPMYGGYGPQYGHQVGSEEEDSQMASRAIMAEGDEDAQNSQEEDFDEDQDGEEIDDQASSV